MTLEQRIAELVTRLRVLSEATAGSVVPKTSHGKASGNAPKGAKPDSKAPPNPDHDPLIVWFLYELDKRGDDDIGRRTLVARTEVILERRLKRQPGRVAGAVFEGAAETTDQRDQRILRDYEGIDEHEAAAYEGEIAGYCSPASVRLTRLRHKRHPHTGDRLDPDSLDPREFARQMKADGMTVTQIALKLGKPKTTVRDWVKDVQRRAA